MVKLCVAGAAGRMGNAIIAEAILKGHQIVGAVDAPNTPSIGKSLKELNVANSDIRIESDKLTKPSQMPMFAGFHLPLPK
jgi:dihydrodipicolinate reductase